MTAIRTARRRPGFRHAEAGQHGNDRGADWILRRFMKKSPFQSNSVFNIPHFAAGGKFLVVLLRKKEIMT